MREYRENKADRWIRNLLDHYGAELGLFALLLISMVIRILLTPNTDLSPDYNPAYKVWMDAYREQGIAEGLRKVIEGNIYYIPMNLIYAIAAQLPVPYYVSLSLVSCAADYVSVLFLYRILLAVRKPQEKPDIRLQSPANAGRVMKLKAAYISVSVLYIPAVMWNSALWKQCEAIYTCFAIISLYEVLREKYTGAFVFFAISFAFKQQAVLFFPFYVLLYLIRRRFSFLQFFWIPAVYLLAGLPGVICHRGIRDTYLVYYYQTQATSTLDFGLNSYFPNIYAFGLDNFTDVWKMPAIACAAAVFIPVLVFFSRHRKNVDDRILVFLFAWCYLTCCIFLPGIHERYDYPVLMILTVYALSCRRRLLPEVLAMIFCSVITYTMILFHMEGQTLPLPVLGIIYLVSYALLTYDLVRQTGKEPDGAAARG